MKKGKILLWIGLGLLIVVIAAGFGYLYYINQQTTKELNEQKALSSTLLRNTSRMCSAYSIREARNLLEGEVNTGSVSYPSGMFAAIEGSEVKPQVDGCSYIGKTNNNRYIYINAQAYDSIEDAKTDFANQKKQLQNSTTINATGYGDEMIYYAGAYFIRDKDVIIAVSVSKPGVSGADQEKLTKSVLDTVYSDASAIFD